jgi:copper chaperone CopZ
METKFKTNIKCAACVEKVTPALNETVGKNQWHIDLTNPSRTLTLSPDVDPEKVNEELKKVGYRIERMPTV